MQSSSFDTSALESLQRFRPDKDQFSLLSAPVEAVKLENEKLREEISQYRTQLKQLTGSAELNYNQARKYRKKYKDVSNELAEALEQVNAVTLERDKAKRENVAAVEDVRLLKLQLEAAHATHLESQTAWNALQSKMKQLETTTKALNEQIESQRVEIAELSDARAKCVNLMELMHRALCKSESTIADLIVENQKRKNVELKPAEPEFRLSECHIPFKGELLERVAGIWNDESTGMKQRIQTSLNEAARVIDALEGQVNAKPNVDEETVARLENENQNYRSALGTLLGSLKQLAATEEMAAQAVFYTPDASWVQFLARTCFDGCDYLRSGFSSYAILGEENQYQRIGLVKEIAALGPQAEAFIAGLLTVNNHLTKEVRKLVASAAHKEEIEQAMQVVGVSNPSDFPERIDDIRNEVMKLVEYKKKVKAVARELQDELAAKESELATANARVDELEVETEHLQSELQVLSNKILLNSSVTSSDRSRSVSSIVDQKTSALEGKIVSLENKLIEKEKELYDFREMHMRATQQAELAAQKVQSLTAKLETMQEAYQQLKMRDLTSKDRYKKKVHTLTKQHMRELSEQRAKLEDAQQTLNATSTDLQERINQTNVLSKKLADSLAESERRNQVLNEEVSRLTTSKQKLEARVKALEDRNDKEKQMCQVQATARILAAETRLHESSTKEKTSLLKEINQLTGYIADELGTFYGLSGASLDSEACRQLLIRAKADLVRATKP